MVVVDKLTHRTGRLHLTGLLQELQKQEIPRLVNAWRKAGRKVGNGELRVSRGSRVCKQAGKHI